MTDGTGNGPSRRRFLGRMAAMAGCGLVSAFPRPPIAEAKRWRDNVPARPEYSDQRLAFDLHTHPGLFPSRGVSPVYPGDEAVARTVADMLVGRVAGAFFSLVADLKILAFGPDGVSTTRAFEPGEAWADYERQIAALRELLEALPAEWATRSADLESLSERGRVAAFVACEGGDCLEGRPERLERLYADGVRSLQLVHYAQNELGDLQTAEPVHGGLSPIGREVVREMNRLGMVIDVAHASFRTTADIAETSDAPLILSHGQLARADRRHPRLLDTEHAQLVAATGGAIGMWPSGFGNDTFEDFVQGTLDMVELVGVDHVGLGTDMDGNYMPVLDSYRQLPTWTYALVADGLSEEEAGRLAGGNALRVLRRVVG